MYDIGDVVHLTVSFYDQVGNPLDPDSLLVTITLPDLTTTTVIPVQDSSGVYHYDYTAVQPGRHGVSWAGTGANAGAYTDVFDVSPADAGFVIGLTEAKKQLSITTTSNDDELRTWLGVTTDIVEYFCGDVVPRTWTESYDGGVTSIALRHHPVISVTSVSEWIGSTLYTLTNQPFGSSTSPYAFTLDDPLSGVITRRTSASWSQKFMPGVQNIIVTYVAGLPVMPWYVQGGARLILQNLWSSRRGAMPMPMPAGGAPETTTVNGYAIPMMAVEMLDRGERLPGIA